MGKNKSLKATMQSELDQTKDAKNAKNGFKSNMSAGTYGAGDAYGHHK
ncbi:MAG: hypothetical protein ACRCW2_09170 [Cellulosilyticaceae bacterium]